MTNNKANYTFFLIVFIGFCLRAVFIGRESLSPDEGLYMYMGQSLASNPLALENSSGEFFFQNPPLFLYMLSLLFRAFGVVSMEVAHVLTVLLGSGTIVLTYFIARHLYGTSVALISSALLSVSPLHWWMSTRILIDVPLTFFIYLSLLMLVWNKKGNFFLFSFTSLATKYQAALLFLLPYLNKHRLKKNPRLLISIYLLGLGLIVLFVTLNLKTEIAWLDYFIGAFEFPNPGKIVLETHYFLGPVVFFFFCIGLGSGLKQKAFSPLLMWVIIFGTVRVFLPWGWLRVARYSLPLYPGLIILAAYGGMEGFSFLQKRLPDRKLFISIIFGSILLYTLSISAFRGYHVTDFTSRAFVGYKSVGHFFENKPSDLAILTSSPRQVKYMVPKSKVYNLPSNFTPGDTSKFIRDKGITYVVIDRWSPHQPKWAKRYLLPENGYAPVLRTKNLCILEVAKHEKVP